jgi:hypothetical protein
MKTSIVLSSNRPRFWRGFCDALTNNSTEIEVIIVSPINRPIAPLPMPVRFFRANTSYPLGNEVGARQATGDLLCIPPDDVLFTPGFFDDVVQAAKQASNEFTMFSAKYYHDCDPTTWHAVTHKILNDDTMPLIPLCGVTLTTSHHKLSGIDKRFRGVLWDTDLFMRFHEAGGRTTLLEKHQCREFHLEQSNLFVTHRDHDIQLTRDLWSKDGRLTTTRNMPVMPYSDKETEATEMF